jgi:hypothetical protein
MGSSSDAALSYPPQENTFL